MRSVFAWPLLAYTGLMALSLLYLGEHYAADEAAGLACAVVVWSLVRKYVRAPGRGSGGPLIEVGAGRAEADIARAHDHLAAADEQESVRAKCL